MRITLVLLLVVVLPAGLLAGNRGHKGGGGTRPNWAAEINALEQQKKQLRAGEKTQLQLIEIQFKTHVEALHQQKGAMASALKEKLELEKALAVKRIESRFAYIVKYNAPLQVWYRLDQAAKTLQAVHDHLKTANADYGGSKGAAIRSLGRAVADLQNRLNIHRWLKGEREGTVKNLQAAERDLQNALAYSANKWGVGTPRGMPKAQAASNKQLADGLITIDNTRGLILYAQWEEGLDKTWAQGIKKREAGEIHQTKATFSARIKNVDKEVAQHIEQHKKQLVQNKVQAIAQTKTQTAAAIKQIDAQIRQMKKK
jgi:hypothetical protein